MNGTVTVEIISTGINAQTFEDAIAKIKNLPNFSKASIYQENDLEFSFSFAGQFPCYGRMENKRLKIL